MQFSHVGYWTHDLRSRAFDLSRSQVILTISIELSWYTTGHRSFAEWFCHSAKAQIRILGKASTILGKKHTINFWSVKRSLPSIFCQAFGKSFAECLTLGKGENKKNPRKIGVCCGEGLPSASAHSHPLKSQVAAFFTQNSQLRSRWDSNSWSLAQLPL